MPIPIPNPPTPPSSDASQPLDPAVAARIDELMAGPVKPMPKVIVVGDEAVSGFTPAPPASSGD